jgi:hypothetical protein
MNRRIGLLAICVGFFQVGYAQLDTIYNTNSPMFRTAERIAYYEQLYRFRVTRFVDLAEKQNKGFKSAKSNIGELILNLINLHKIKPYSGAYGDPTSFENVMPDSVAMVIKPNYARSDTRGNWNATTPYQAGEKVIVTETDPKTGVTQDMVYTAQQDNTGKPPSAGGGFWQVPGDPFNTLLQKGDVVGIELIEDVIFDKRKSRLTYDILAIGVVIIDPSSGAMQTRLYISYSDLVTEIERLFKSRKPSERASVVWQNRYNPSESKKFTDAFKLRLFHGVVEKVENPDDNTILEIIYDKSKGRGSYAEGVYAMWEKEMEMMEKEHNLWEF